MMRMNVFPLNSFGTTSSHYNVGHIFYTEKLFKEIGKIVSVINFFGI